MKKRLFIMISLFIIPSCSSDDSKDTTGNFSPETSGGATASGNGTIGSGASGCGFRNGKALHLGEQGGCYYINSNGKKTYVDRSYCKC